MITDEFWPVLHKDIRHHGFGDAWRPQVSAGLQ
jgi:hypothetical protein